MRTLVVLVVVSSNCAPTNAAILSECQHGRCSSLETGVGGVLSRQTRFHESVSAVQDYSQGATYLPCHSWTLLRRAQRAAASEARV